MYDTAPYYIDQKDHFSRTPVRFYVASDSSGNDVQAIVYNPTNNHVFTPEETAQLIALLQAYIDQNKEQESG